MPANNSGHAYNELIWHPIKMLDLKHLKEAIMLYGLHSPFVKEILNNWAMQHRVIPQDWMEGVSALLESGLQLQWWL